MDKFEIYTDGACNNLIPPKYGAWAFVILEDGNIIHEGKGSESNTTNNRMELFAIISSLTEIPNDSIIKIYTDSEYCIRVLSNMKKNFPANMDLIEQYRQIVLEMNYSIKFSWVKGHNGNKYNEMVDKMANEEYEKISGHKIPDYTKVEKEKKPRKKRKSKEEKQDEEEIIQMLIDQRDYWKGKYTSLVSRIKVLLD